MPATAPTNATIAIMNAESESARSKFQDTTERDNQILPTTTMAVISVAMLAAAWIHSAMPRLRVALINAEATAGIKRSTIKIIVTVHHLSRFAGVRNSPTWKRRGVPLYARR